MKLGASIGMSENGAFQTYSKGQVWGQNLPLGLGPGSANYDLSALSHFAHGVIYDNYPTVGHRTHEM
jgi:hypothetical protein